MSGFFEFQEITSPGGIIIKVILAKVAQYYLIAPPNLALSEWNRLSTLKRPIVLLFI